MKKLNIACNYSCMLFNQIFNTCKLKGEIWIAKFAFRIGKK